MDAAPSTSERTRELAELRSRAYGPDADIDRDADALARLIELEELERGDAAVESVVTEAGDAGPGEEAAPTPVNQRGGWRRVPVWAYIAVAALIGLGVGLAVPALTSPRPVAILRPVPFVDGVEPDFRMYGMPAESPVRYQPFHGLEVWSAATEEGSDCVAVTTADGEWMTAGCAPEPLTATADISLYPGMRQIEGLELADGSVVRFILRDDVMEVWIAETDQTA